MTTHTAAEICVLIYEALGALGGSSSQMSMTRTLTVDEGNEERTTQQQQQQGDNADSRLDSVEEERDSSVGKGMTAQHTKDGILDVSPGKCSECMKPLMKNFFPCAPLSPTASCCRSCSFSVHYQVGPSRSL
jgi:hypothetical protein